MKMRVPDQNGFTQRKDRARIFPGRKNGEIGITICIENILYTYGKAKFERKQIAGVISPVAAQAAASGKK
ncbi:hypothetical protein [Collimonas sp. PA-H2]|uniref:hypothetical protein n=1 Tax=Collimonas sp. PA-H2 TaxID=1881062 RepID=UPI00117BF312|nr:hypothetical protein [Collimonas sp. PA-H2]